MMSLSCIVMIFLVFASKTQPEVLPDQFVSLFSQNITEFGLGNSEREELKENVTLESRNLNSQKNIGNAADLILDGSMVANNSVTENDLIEFQSPNGRENYKEKKLAAVTEDGLFSVGTSWNSSGQKTSKSMLDLNDFYTEQPKVTSTQMNDLDFVDQMLSTERVDMWAVKLTEIETDNNTSSNITDIGANDFTVSGTLEGELSLTKSWEEHKSTISTVRTTTKHPDYSIQTSSLSTVKTLGGSPSQKFQCLQQPLEDISRIEAANAVTLYMKGHRSWSERESAQFCELLTGIVYQSAVKDKLISEAESVTVVFIADTKTDHSIMSFFALNNEGDALPGSLIQGAVLLSTSAIESQTSEELSEVITNVYGDYRIEQSRHALFDSVLATAVVAVAVSVSAAAAVSLLALLCWHRYKRRYYGEWIVNKRSQGSDRVDAWCYYNNAFSGTEEVKQIDGCYSCVVDRTREDGKGGNVAPVPVSEQSGGWLFPKEMMEIVERGQLSG